MTFTKKKAGFHFLGSPGLGLAAVRIQLTPAHEALLWVGLLSPALVTIHQILLPQPLLLPRMPQPSMAIPSVRIKTPLEENQWLEDSKGGSYNNPRHWPSVSNTPRLLLGGGKSPAGL